MVRASSMRKTYSLRMSWHEIPDRGVRLAGHLQLRDVAAVELNMTGPRQRPLDVLSECERHEGVLAPPDEQCVALEAPEARPETVVTVGLVHVDVAGGLVERRAPARCEIAAQELVDARGDPAVVGAGDKPPHD